MNYADTLPDGLFLPHAVLMQNANHTGLKQAVSASNGAILKFLSVGLPAAAPRSRLANQERPALQLEQPHSPDKNPRQAFTRFAPIQSIIWSDNKHVAIFGN